MHLAFFWKANGSVHIMSERYPDKNHPFSVKRVIKKETIYA